MKKHSPIGGSVAKQVMACPGSVNLCSQVPPPQATSHADRGSLLHLAVDLCISDDMAPHDLVGNVRYKDVELTDDLLEDKLRPALNLFDDYMEEIDPAGEAEYTTEKEVTFGHYIEGAYGTCDVLIRAGNRAVVLDWKFGSGVAVEAEENAQLMFYAAAAKRTPGLEWVFNGATELELVIIQPPAIKRWVTSFERIAAFEVEYKAAVKVSKSLDAPIKQGDHCRFCDAKPICPLMERAAKTATGINLREVDIQKMGHALLEQAELLEGWIADLRTLAHRALESGAKVPGWKLVYKRATRKWADGDEKLIIAKLQDAIPRSTTFGRDGFYKKELLSVAQMEKALKKIGVDIPSGMVSKESSGTTIAPVDDPRPAATNDLLIGQQLKNALNKLK